MESVRQVEEFERGRQLTRGSLMSATRETAETKDDQDEKDWEITLKPSAEIIKGMH
jgi:hypothetical protein